MSLLTSRREVSLRHARWLWVLLGLFIFRVIAQPVAWLTNASFLPKFASWQGGVVPYPVLLAAQLVLIGWLARTAWRMTRGEVIPRRRLGLVFLILGAVYLTSMLLRLVLGATLLKQQRWFASPVPTCFHLVLAAYALVYGHFHFRPGRDALREREAS